MNMKDFFKVYDAVLDKDYCEEIINQFDNSPLKEAGRVGNGTEEGVVDTTRKNTQELVLSMGGEWEEVLLGLSNSIGRYLPKYIENWKAAFTVPLRPEPIRIQKYPPGGHFSWHSDNMGGSITRVLTIIWYLNDVTEGGETEYIWQDMKIKPKAGSMLICPVGWPFFHCGRPPVNDNKYIAITQLHQVLRNE